MYRDFSEAAKQRLLGLVEEVENEKWNDFTDWVGDRWLDFQSWIGQLNIKNYLDNVNEYHKKVIDKNNTTQSKIDEIFAKVHDVDHRYHGIFGSDLEILSVIEDYLTGMISVVAPVNGSLKAGIIRVRNAVLSQKLEQLKKNLTKLSMQLNHCLVFPVGSKERYGGDQGYPQQASRSRREEYYQIIKRNNPDPNFELDDEELKAFLKKLNNEGCGYVALVNTIFNYYLDDPDGFQEAFGYPMRDEHGQLNFDLLLVDLYSKTDSVYSGSDYDEKHDGPKASYDPLRDETGHGTTQYDRENILENFMSEHGVQVDVKTDAQVTVDNYDEITSSGKMVIVAFRNGYLYNMDGSIKQAIKGGHAMVVTGVTDEGYMIVSSWGGQYYIKPDEVVELEYEGEKYKTSMTFSTVEYD